MIPVIAGLAAVWAATKIGGYLEDKLDPQRHEREAMLREREKRAAYVKTREGRTMIYNAYLEYKKRMAGGDTSVAVGLRIRDLEYQYIHSGELPIEKYYYVKPDVDGESTPDVESVEEAKPTQETESVQDDKSTSDVKSESENV